VVWQQRLSGKLAFGRVWLCRHVPNLVAEGFEAFAKGLVGLLSSLAHGGLLGSVFEELHPASGARQRACWCRCYSIGELCSLAASSLESDAFEQFGRRLDIRFCCRCQPSLCAHAYQATKYPGQKGSYIF
jgi:hypothetical protein